jgi:hypothetical protein
MQPPPIASPLRFTLAALAAGGWVVISGMLMAAAFGYRDMKSAFDAIGLPLPQGAGSLIVHTLVRLALGAAVVALVVVFARVFSSGRAVPLAAAFVWLLATVLPYAVVADWGVLPWSLAARVWAWSAAELLIAAVIGRLLGLPVGGTAP